MSSKGPSLVKCKQRWHGCVGGHKQWLLSRFEEENSLCSAGRTYMNPKHTHVETVCRGRALDVELLLTAAVGHFNLPRPRLNTHESTLAATAGLLLDQNFLKLLAVVPLRLKLTVPSSRETGLELRACFVSCHNCRQVACSAPHDWAKCRAAKMEDY